MKLRSFWGFNLVTRQDAIMNQKKCLEFGIWKKLNSQIVIPEKVKRNLMIFLLIIIQTVFMFINFEFVSREKMLFFPLKVLDYLKSVNAMYSILITATIIIILMTIVNNFWIQYIILIGISYIIGIINKSLIIERKDFLRIQHFSLLDEVKNINISSLPDIVSVMDVLLLITELVFLIGVLYYLKKSKINLNLKSKARVVLLLCGTAFFVFFTNTLNKIDSFNRARGILSAEKLGAVVCFVESFYSDNGTFENNIDQIFETTIEKLSSGTESFYSDKINKPNIIVIMSEAFWDIRNLYGIIDTQKDAYELFDSIKKQCTSGEIAVNTYGGGTVTTEFEFLTGFNAFDLCSTNSYYSTYFDKKQGSFVTYLNGMGYESIAIHPYGGSMWSRDLGYKNMGFSSFIDIDSFGLPGSYRGFVSDDTLTDKIIETYEENRKQNNSSPLFCFSVSVANHVTELSSAYLGEEVYERNIEVGFGNLNIDDKRKKEIEEYVNGIEDSTEALRKLMDYFSDKEDTVIVFFGDHAPYFAENMLELDGSHNIDKAYRTPYLIWSNYNSDIKEYGNFNSSYFSSVLIDYLGFPKAKICYYNDYMRSKYPINTIYEIYTSDGTDLRKKLENLIIDSEVEDYIDSSKQEIQFTNWSLKNGIEKGNVWVIQ